MGHGPAGREARAGLGRWAHPATTGWLAGEGSMLTRVMRSTSSVTLREVRRLDERGPTVISLSPTI